jgi:hypothetical protein
MTEELTEWEAEVARIKHVQVTRLEIGLPQDVKDAADRIPRGGSLGYGRLGEATEVERISEVLATLMRSLSEPSDASAQTKQPSEVR